MRTTVVVMGQIPWFSLTSLLILLWSMNTLAQDAEASDAVTELVQGNTIFALELYQALRQEEGNLFFSPYSISQALAMTYAGADGETAEQMAEVLHFVLPKEELYEAFGAVDDQLLRSGEGAQERGEDGLELAIANALWAQEGYPFRQDYLALLERHFGAGLRTVDFVEATEASRSEINAWVEARTNGRITELLSGGAITPETRLVLTNAIYFNAAWQHPFDEPRTEPAPFTLLDGDRIEVPMMEQTARFAYVEGDDFQAVELPYDGEQLSMIILLPAEGRFETVEANLSVEQFTAITEQLADMQNEIHLFLPRFSYSSSFSLRDTLAAMGMTQAFDPNQADFSGMLEQREDGLAVDDVIHKAFVVTNEEGTEAAAATGVTFGVTSTARPPLEVRIDRPFIYAIREQDTDAVLFLGRVLNPLE